VDDEKVPTANVCLVQLFQEVVYTCGSPLEPFCLFERGVPNAGAAALFH
jgi:hypothetical protein